MSFSNYQYYNFDDQSIVIDGVVDSFNGTPDLNGNVETSASRIPNPEPQPSHSTYPTQPAVNISTINQNSSSENFHFVARPWVQKAIHAYTNMATSEHYEHRCHGATTWESESTGYQHHDLQGIGAWVQQTPMFITGASKANAHPMRHSRLQGGCDHSQYKSTDDSSYAQTAANINNNLMTKWQQESATSQPWHAIECIHSHVCHRLQNSPTAYRQTSRNTGIEGVDRQDVDEVQVEFADMHSMACNTSEF
jgi:hypothetical protein